MNHYIMQALRGNKLIDEYILIETFINGLYNNELINMKHMVSPLFSYKIPSKKSLNFEQFLAHENVQNHNANVIIKKIKPKMPNVFVAHYTLSMRNMPNKNSGNILGMAQFFIKNNRIEMLEIHYNSKNLQVC